MVVVKSVQICLPLIGEPLYGSQIPCHFVMASPNDTPTTEQSSGQAAEKSNANPRELFRQRRIRNASRLADDTNNACIKESQQSLKCIMDNDFDRDKCTLFFQNYRNCLDFWKRVYKDRRRAGIQPYMPPASERDGIKEEYYRKSLGTRKQ